MSVEPGGQRAGGKARIGSVQTAGTSICAGEEGLALEAPLIGGQLIRCVLQFVHRGPGFSPSARVSVKVAAKLRKISLSTRVNYTRSASVVGFC